MTWAAPADVSAMLHEHHYLGPLRRGVAWVNDAGCIDRWVYALRKDSARPEILVAKDDAVLKRMPWARYEEPGGADYKRWKAEQAKA